MFFRYRVNKNYLAKDGNESGCIVNYESAGENLGRPDLELNWWKIPI